MTYASARDLRADTAQMYAPPENISVSEGIARTLGDAYESDLAPYMAKPADSLDSRRYGTVVFVGPARCSKTLTLMDGWAARNIVHAPGDMLIMQASQDLARYYSKIRLDRMIAATPSVKARLSPRRQDDNTYDKLMRSGMVLSIGWPSGAQLSGRDFRYVAITEYDLAADDIDEEGSLYSLAAMRTQTFLSAGKVVVESSVRRIATDPQWRAPPGSPHMAPPVTGITGLYNSGTRNWYYWQCKHCAEWMALHPDVHVMFDLPPIDQLVEELPTSDATKWARSMAQMRCPSCSHVIRHQEKRELNLSGIWVPDGCTVSGNREIHGEPRQTDIDSYQLSCVAACYASWPNILEKYATAIQDYVRTGSEVEIKSTVNLAQGRAYLPIAVGKRRQNHELQARAETWPEMTVPLGVRFLTAQIDVQAGKWPRFVVQVHGVGKNRERWIVDRFALKSSRRQALDDSGVPQVDKNGAPVWLPIDPASYTEDWDRIIEKVIERRYPLADESGRTMPVRLVICDSGGKAGVTRRAYEFWRRLKAKNLDGRFRLLKGAERDGAKTIDETWPDATKRSDSNSGAAKDVPVLIVNVTTIKDVVMADVWRTSPGQGYYHFPTWLKSSFYDELTVETRGPKRWVCPDGKSNETTDLCMMGEVAVLWLKADRINWNAPPSWAAEWDSNPDVYATAPEVKPVVQRQRRVIRSKYLGN